MNLHGIVAPIIGTVNPNVPATMQVSTGYTIAPDGSQAPGYTTVTGTAQVQALTYQDLRQIDGLNLNGERRSIYFYGAFTAVNRPSSQGGDLVILTDGHNAGTWLIAFVAEQWPDWCKVICTLQNGG